MMIDLGWRLYQARKRVGLSQEELAGKLNVSRQAISKWERGEAVPDVTNLIALSKLFGVTVDDLLTGTAEAAKGKGAEPAEKEEQTQQEDAYYTVDDTRDGSASYMNDDARRSELDAFMDDIPLIEKRVEERVERFTSNIEASVERAAKKMDRDLEFNIAGVKAQFNRKRALQASYPMIITVAYILLGFMFDWWHPGWLLFLTIPLYYTWPDMEHGDPVRELQKFAYPVFVTLVYLILGCYLDWWHPWWMLYFTIPIYYIFVSNAKVSK